MRRVKWRTGRQTHRQGKLKLQSQNPRVQYEGVKKPGREEEWVSSGNFLDVDLPLRRGVSVFFFAFFPLSGSRWRCSDFAEANPLLQVVGKAGPEQLHLHFDQPSNVKLAGAAPGHDLSIFNQRSDVGIRVLRKMIVQRFLRSRSTEGLPLPLF